MMIASYIVSS